MSTAATEPAAETVISVEDVTIAYGDNVIQKNVSFEVRRGEVFVILGGSGCGKSSLLKIMIGLYKPVSGRVLFDGEDIVTAEGDDRQRLLRKFGVMYQSGALFGSMSVIENVRLPLDEFTDIGAYEKELVAAAKLNQVGLLAAAARKPAALSGGMQKRAGIARAMALDPGILFLDEPSAGLDPITSAGLDDTIRNLSRGLGITFVVVTHELQSIYAIADRCIMLDARTRTMIAEGKPADLRDHSPDPYVRQFFLRQAEPAAAADGGSRAS
jgi:phospholipid/cholesterol/gamma-HCH transport system ATP-binding protein